MRRVSNGAVEYTAPTMEFIEVTVEFGFSNSLEDPSENEEIDW
jgi:hypothetical protein